MTLGTGIVISVSILCATLIILVILGMRINARNLKAAEKAVNYLKKDLRDWK